MANDKSLAMAAVSFAEHASNLLSGRTRFGTELDINVIPRRSMLLWNHGSVVRDCSLSQANKEKNFAGASASLTKWPWCHFHSGSPNVRSRDGSIASLLKLPAIRKISGGFENPWDDDHDFDFDEIRSTDKSRINLAAFYIRSSLHKYERPASYSTNYS